MRYVVSVLVALALWACGGEDGEDGEDGQDAPIPSSADISPLNLGDVYYQSMCASCHGEDGDGNGSVASALNPKPRDFRDKAWQAKTSDRKIHSVILNGGAAEGLSPLMPPARWLQPEDEPTPDDQIDLIIGGELVDVVRRFGEN